MIQIKRELITAEDDSREAKIASLKRSLQTAIELEHSTIPPYLYATYSLGSEANREIVGILLSVVKEEMLHMALDCNVLNAMDGSPCIDHPRFIPHYPGPLPGTVESGLVVGLAPFSKQLVQDVFSVIEEPEDPITTGDSAHVRPAAAPPEDDHLTIGEFYEALKTQIRDLCKGGNIFTGKPEKQVSTGFRALQNIAVTDEKSALAALDLIVHQGEGSRRSPLDPELELAHYYKYQEVYFGRKLIRLEDEPNPRWAYVGHAISYDPAGVRPVIANPSRATYQPGSRLRSLNDTFNFTYTNMLKALHRVFNGQPDTLGPALLGMQSLKAQAQVLMATSIVPGLNAGPSFEYTPRLPDNGSPEAAS
jgi:hypothetical protein